MKKNEKTPFELSALFQILIDAMPDIVVVKDAEGRHLIVNKATEEFTGHKRESVLGKTMEEIAPMDIAAACRKSDEQALRCTTSLRATESSTGSDGKVTVLDTLKSPIHDKEGRLLGLVAVSRDVTEYKKIEDSLRQSENFIRNILETVDEGFIVIDRDYKIQAVNRAYLDQVGNKSSEEVIGRYCYEISHHVDRPCHELGETCTVRNTFNTGEPDTALHVHEENGKRKIYVETKAFPLKDGDGITHSVIEVTNNITEKVKLEEQLRHSQKMDAIGQLAGGIAHDFNNILTAIIGYGHIIKNRTRGIDTVQHDIEQILDAADRASYLTRGLLAFSRKEPLTMKPIDLVVVLQHVEKLLRGIIGETIDLRFDVPGHDMVAMADSGQIEQILINLAANARDAMPDGGSLTFRMETVVLDQDFVNMHGYGKPGIYGRLTATDTGKGMDEQTREKIFEPFFTTKEVGRGTGLGLSIVYGIVKQHNGYINCYSEPGRGTEFKIYLPLTADKDTGIKADTMDENLEGTETILVAEDNERVRILLKDILGQHGYTVIVAGDGDEAVSQFMRNSGRIQLVVLDVIMPKKDGKMVYEEIRKVAPGIKVVFMSGYAGDMMRMNNIVEDKQAFLSKPITPTELLKVVRAMLDSAGGGS